jgi:outer membrane protein OmpA-like peptidoglycan-associated protein
VFNQRRAIEVATFVLGLSGMLGIAHAEPLLVSLEGQGAVAVTTPQSEQFGPGLNVALSVRYPLGPMLQVGAEARAGLLSAGEEAEFASGREEPRPGSYELGMLMLRVKPLAMVDGTSPRRAAGLFLDLGGGGGVTGKVARVGFQGGLGFGFGLGGGITIAPTVRYLQVIQPADPLSSRDARLMLFGLELSVFDAVARVHHALPERVVTPPPPAAVVETDRDHDGVDDARDQCPDAAEDDDGFEDADGCPELDNDRDGVADAQDACPDAAEDLDRNEDADGCPDADDDRDHDHIVDANDKCPDEPEVVNGNADEDGCPDEGLIVLEDDRIVLDAQVLFDAGFARVRHAAWAALDAIAKLKKQHPEWVKIRIEGHADARGPEKLNQQLSERRARNTMKHLIKIGVPADQLESYGYGSSRPRDPGKSEEANRRNRRVEFVVLRASPEEAQAAPEQSEPAKHPVLRLGAPVEQAAPPESRAPVKPSTSEDAPAPPPPPSTKSGLTPSGLRPIPAEKK